MYSNCTLETVRGSVSSKEKKSQGKAVEVTVNSKEANLRLLSGFRQRNRPLNYETVCSGNGRRKSSQIIKYMYMDIINYRNKTQIGLCVHCQSSNLHYQANRQKIFS